MGLAEIRVPSPASGVETVEHTKRGLKELLGDERFWIQSRLPITKRRAISQVSNPRAEDDDTVLITAYCYGELVAYLGILPDSVVIESREPVKFGWLTAWWADKRSEYRLAGMKVLVAAMKKYPNRLAASSPVTEAAQVYTGTRRFQNGGSLNSACFVIALPPSLPVLGNLSRWLAGRKNQLILGRQSAKRGLDIQIVQTLDGENESFINKRATEDPLRRDSSYWNWVLRFPWMSANSDDEVAQRSYAFSVFARDFKQIPMFIRRLGTIIAFLFMILREGRLVLKCAWYKPSDISDVAVALREAVADLNPWLFVCADADLCARLAGGVPFYTAKRMRTSAIYAANRLPLPPACRLQLGAGDSIFT
ncbi:MAG TPA: hypothetical protein VMH00_10545 [Candidatus Limnocylindrales bacterium]|nr:hypothetical protein [Candidatus Limnocylindrales bacterium]